MISSLVGPGGGGASVAGLKSLWAGSSTFLEQPAATTNESSATATTILFMRTPLIGASRVVVTGAAMEATAIGEATRRAPWRAAGRRGAPRGTPSPLPADRG